jgi:hypothetical protein
MDRFIGSQLIRMNRNQGKWQANNNSVYDSIIYPLAKAVNQERAEIREGAFGSGDQDEAMQRLMPTFYYIFPMLVTSAPVYTVDVTSEKTPLVTRAPWAPLTRHFKDGLFMMDVVDFNHLDTYLKERIFPSIEDARKAISEHAGVFDPEWLVAQFGQPSDATFNKWMSEFKAEFRSSRKSNEIG